MTVPPRHAATSSPTPVLELVGERTRPSALLADLWRHRDLVYMLARQDYRSRYRSASLGLAWAVFLPMLQGVVIAIVFTHLTGGGRPSSFVPYVITGVTTYGYISSSLSAASTSIVDGGGIASRLYFPRMVLSMLAPTANLPGVLISLGIALLVSLLTTGDPGLSLLLLPVAVLAMWLLVVTFGSLLAMLHVYSRDVRYIVQAVMLVLFYATPVIYRLSGPKGVVALPDGLVPFVLANPVTGVVQLMRQALIGDAEHVLEASLVSAAWIVVVGITSVLVYARRERVALDRL